MRRYFRDPLQRPILTFLGFLAFAAVVGGGAWVMFGVGGPPVSAEHEAVVDTLDLDGGICCIHHLETDGVEYLFVAAEEPGGILIRTRNVTLRVIEISDDGLEEIMSLDAPVDSPLPWSMAMIGDTAYLPLEDPDQDDAGIWVLDVSDPEDPVELSMFETDERVREIVAPGKDLLAAHVPGQFRYYDASEPGSLELIGTFRQPVFVAQQMILDLDAGQMYDREIRSNRIRISDISELDSASPLGRHLNEAGASSQPARLGTVIGNATDRLEQTAPSRQFQDFAVSDHVLYVAASDLGLEIVDVSDGTAPELLDRIELEGRVVRTKIAGDTLHVVTASEESRERVAYEVHTFDITEPGEPELISTVDDIRAAPGRQAIEAGGGYVFLGLSDTIVMIDSDS